VPATGAAISKGIFLQQLLTVPTRQIRQVVRAINQSFLDIYELDSLLHMGLYQPLDGITNLKYKLLCLLTPKNIFLRETL
jgi:hypothetical protein